MKHLKVFETVAAFEAAESTLDKPNVSLIEATNGINYLPYIAPDPYNGHEYVEIAGLKWATKNVGANSITDTGLYFQWGDTQGYTSSQVGSGQKYFGWADYKFNPSGDGKTFTKYNDTDGLTTLEISDDAARANMGGSWRMPTTTELQNLGAAVNTVWTADYNGSGVAGLVCTAKDGSGAQLFFPAVGYYSKGSVYFVGNVGFYWSSSLYSIDVIKAWNLSFDNGGNNWDNNYGRYYGCAVRGVAD